VTVSLSPPRLLTLLSLVAALGCAGEDGSPDGLPNPPPAGEWIEVVPGGDTICARGTEYRFFVRGGRSDRIIVDFQGGGACWNRIFCSVGDALFSDDTGDLDSFVASIDAGRVAGIFDPDPDSPFADWTIVHIPYCTGDIHWGDAFQDYGGGVTIEHRGFVNASAALDWVYSRFPSPENVFVTGCSAGAYGAALHSAYIGEHYPEASMSVLADSGAGIITDSFLMDSLPNWNAEANLPTFVDGLDQPISELTLPALYTAIGRHFPEHRFAQTATAYDADQIFFYEAMGGDAADWPDLFRSSMVDIEGSLPNFRSYIPPGSMHCVTPYPFFATREVDGQNLRDWASDLATGEMPESAACDGAECCDDPVCDACIGATDSWCRFCEDWPPTWSECAAAPAP
jgi:hypothetical protein